MNKKDEINSLCNHNYNDTNTTIRFLKKKKMVYPNKQEGICIYCQKNFIIEQQKD